MLAPTLKMQLSMHAEDKATVSRIIRMGVTGATILKGLRNAGQSLGVLTFAFTDVRVGASSRPGAASLRRVRG